MNPSSGHASGSSDPKSPEKDFEFSALKTLESASSLEADAVNTTGALAGKRSDTPQADAYLAAKEHALKRRRIIGFSLLALAIIAGILLIFVLQGKQKTADIERQDASKRYSTTTIPLAELVNGSGATVVNNQVLSVNGQLNVNNALVLTPGVKPTTAITGQFYFDQTTNKLMYYDGTQFQAVAAGSDIPVVTPTPSTSIGGATGAIGLGSGLSAAGNTLSNTGVLTLQGQAGNLTLTSGGGIAINGTTLSNSGVLSLGGQNGAISVGDGLSAAGGQLKNTGIISAVGAGIITVTNDGNGNIVIDGPTGSGGGSGTVASPGGTIGRIAKFTGVQTVADSLLSESGSVVTVNGNLSVTGSLSLSTALSVTNGGTGATGASGARSNLGAAASGANSDITSLSGLTTALSVAQGGTGVGSLPTNGVIIGNGTSPLSAVVAGAAGQCLVSTGGAPTFAACPGAGGVSSLNGGSGALTLNNASLSGSTITINDATTAVKGIASFNGTNFSVSSGAVNTIQNINTTAAPTFGQLSLTSSQATNPMLLVNNTNGSATGNLLDLQLNGSSRLSVAPSGNLTTSGTITSGTINGQTISSSASFTGSVAVGTTLSVNTVTPSGSLTVGATGQSFTLQGNASSRLTATNGANVTTVGFQSPTASVTYNFATAAAGAYNVCTTAGNCVGTGGSVSTGGGTTNQLAKFTGSSSIGDSIISDNGSTVTIGGTLSVNTLTPTAALTIGAAGQNLTLQGANVSLSRTSGGTTNSIVFANPSGGNKTITVPNATGTVAVSASGPLVLDSLGNLTCPTCLSGGGGGSGVSSVNGLSGALVLQGSDAASFTNGGTTITVNDASDTVKGLAKFNSTNLTVTSGTVNTVQNISVTSTPTFGGLNLTTALTVGNGGTGATTASGARTNLGAAASGANSDITSLSGLTTALSVAQGGTGVNTLAANGVLVGNGTSAITSLTGSNGQCLVISGGAPVFTTCPGSGGSYVNLQVSTPGTQQTGHLNISGTGIFGTALQAPSFDTASASALNLGTTNATSINLNQDTTLAAGKALTITGGNTGSRPASPAEGMVYFDTTTKKLLTYSNGKWQADRSAAILVAANDSTQADKDAADYVAGAANAQATIASAISALPTNGGTVYLLPGTYSFGANLDITKGGVTLTGAGQNATNIVRAFNGSTLANGSLIKVSADHVTITQLTLDGVRATYTNANNHGVYEVSNHRYLNLTSTQILGTAGTGFYLVSSSGSDFNTVSNNVIDDAAGGISITQVQATGQVVRNNTVTNIDGTAIDVWAGTITGNEVAGANTGIYGGVGSTAVITDNTVRNSAIGIDASGGTVSDNLIVDNTLAIITNGGTITGNTIQNNGAGIEITHGTGTLTITGNRIYGNNAEGIYVSVGGTDTSNITISANTIQDNGAAGIYLNARGVGIIITGNTLQGNGGSSGYMGEDGSASIYLESGDNYNRITNNNIINIPGTTYAIKVAGTGNYLSGNTFDSSGLGLLDSGTNTIYGGQMATSSGNFVFRGSSNSSSAFAIQNAAGTSIFNVNTTSGLVTVTGTVNATTGYQFNGTAGSTTTCSGGNVLQNAVIQGGIITGGTCVANGGGVSPTLQNVYDNSGTANPQIQLSNTNGGLKIRDASSSTIGNLFQIQNAAGSSTYFAVTASGLTESGTATIGGAANTTQLIVKANASQSGSNPLIMLQTSGGSELARINSTAAGDTYFGWRSGVSQSGGSGLNTGMGAGALTNLTTGNTNTAIGEEALTSLTTGNQNTAIGQNAGGTVTGSRNTAIGQNALVGVVNSDSNTAVGSGAGAVTGAGSNFYNNVFLGYGAGSQDNDTFVTTTTLQNSTAIGFNSQVQSNNTIVLGGIGNDAQKVVIGSTMSTGSNLFSVSPVIYSTGTASQSGSTITGSGTTWNSGNGVRVGMRFIFANGTDGGTITAVNSTTSLTVSTSQTVSSQKYRIHNVGFQVDNSGNAYVRSTSTSAFSIQDANAVNLFNSDTVNGRVTIDGDGNNNGTIGYGLYFGGNFSGEGISSKRTAGGNQNGLDFFTNGSATFQLGNNGAATFKNAFNSTTAFQIQNASGTNLFTTDTSTSTITLGNSGSGNYVTFTAAGGLQSFGTARPTKYISLAAEYTGAVLYGGDTGGANCNTNQNGTMTAGYDTSSTQMNYYNWTSSQATDQCFNVVVRVPLPAGFDGWAAAPSIQVKTDNASNSAYAIGIIKSDGSTYDTNYGSAYTSPGTLGTSWANMSTSSLDGSGYTAGSYMTIRIRMTAKNNANLQLGDIKLAYYSKY